MDNALQMLRWGTATLLFVGFAWLAAYNWRVFWRAFVRREPSPSWIPFLGGACGAAAALLAPLPGSARLWWLPLLLDWGCLPGLGHALYFHARRWVRGRLSPRA